MPRKIVWQPVVFASDLEVCPDCGEPWCHKHQMHFADCECIGPNEDDGVEYDWSGLFARRIIEED